MGALLKNSRGMSMMEMIFGLALLSLVVYGSITLLQTVSTMKLESDAVLQQTVLSQDITLAITSPALCDANFQGKVAQVGSGPQAVQLYRMVDAAGRPASPIARDSYGPLDIQSVSLEFVGRSGSSFLARVTVQPTDRAGGFSFRPMTYNFRLYANDAVVPPVITGCSPPVAIQPLAKLGRCPSDQMVAGLKSDGTLNCAAMPPGPPGPPGPSGDAGASCLGLGTPPGAPGAVCTSAGWAY